MGEVFRAWDSNLRRTVALKVLPLEKVSRPELIERFKAEAQSAARLSHPNVVQVHDWGETDSTYFMVMEHVRGRNLRELLAGRGRLTPRQACEVMMQVLDALQAAHDRGLVHRDVKPENILVTTDGRVKVADFGIARAVETATKTGGLFGTVAYVAPEQARGAPIDGRSDVYSAGCVLFELLTGSRPFDGDAASVLHQHLNGRVPPPSREDPTIDESLDKVVLRATKTGPDERYQSARAMREDLQTVLPSLNGSPPLAELSMELTTEVSPEMLDTQVPEQRKKRRIRWWYFLVLLLIAGAGYASFVFRPVKVPNLEGKRVAEAVTSLEDRDFVTSVERRTSDEPRDTVLRTNPEAGRSIRRGAAVVVVVSRGPELTTLPSLTGLSLDEARAAVEKARLEFGEASERHDPAPKGKVIEQDPGAGRVKVGTPVNVVVSKGPETGLVPDVKGKSFAEASSAITGAGFQVVREDVFNDAPVDQIVDQQPAPSAKVEKGSEVKLIVSKGPQPFAMPDVKGKACQDAKTELEGLGLVVTINSRGSPCGTTKVLDQDPFPGAQVKKGAEATLYIS
jgi:beta-lactam-binding protein with PASTA domain